MVFARGARTALTLAALLALTLAPARALAQPAPASSDERVALRRIALDRAVAASEANHHAEALDFAQRAGALQMTPSVRLFITRELAAVGRNAEALRSAVQCTHEATDAVTRGAEIRAACTQLVAQLGSLTGSIVLRVRGAAPDALRVSIDEAPINAEYVGLPYPVDRGTRRVSVGAQGFVTQTRDLFVDYGATVSAEFTLAATDAAHDVRSPTPARASVGPWVLVGVGGALLVTSGGFVLGSVGALTGCGVEDGVGVCESPGALERANAWSGVTLYGTHVALYAGIAAASAGLLWWALAPRSPAPRNESERAAATLWAAPHPGGMLAGVRVAR